jgi:hypothetical protein
MGHDRNEIQVSALPCACKTNSRICLVKAKLPPGATVIPIIILSDATQLTNFSGGKSAWPVYITIGNIPKNIRAQVSSYSTLLLAYLPVAKFDCFKPKDRGNEVSIVYATNKKDVQ